MAVFKIARDGHFTVAKGYPLVSAPGAEEYDVWPRAEQVFILAGYRHGQVLPKELFYALVVEGDLKLGELDPPNILEVPKEILSQAVKYDENRFFKEDKSSAGGERYVIDYLRVLNGREQIPTPAALREACYYSLACKFRQYLEDRGVLSAGLGRAPKSAPAKPAPAKAAAPKVALAKGAPPQGAELRKSLESAQENAAVLAVHVERLQAELATLRDSLVESKVQAAPAAPLRARKNSSKANESGKGIRRRA